MTFILCVIGHTGSFDLLHVLLQGASKCRMEKAEILEHAVRFLQSIATEGLASGDRGQTPSYQDGVSSCLQRAAQFLAPDWKDTWLGLDPSLAVADSVSLGGCRVDGGRSDFISLPHSKAAVVQMLRQESNQRLQAGVLKRRRFVRPAQLPPLTPAQNHLPARPEEGQESKQSLAQSHPAIQTLWRPWP